MNCKFWYDCDSYESESESESESSNENNDTTNSLLADVQTVLKAWDSYWELSNKDSYACEEFETVSSTLDKAINNLRKANKYSV